MLHWSNTVGNILCKSAKITYFIKIFLYRYEYYIYKFGARYFFQTIKLSYMVKLTYNLCHVTCLALNQPREIFKRYPQ